MNSRSALLVGATGLVGGHVLQLLLDDETYAEVVVLVRKPSFNPHPKLREHIIDFGHLDRHASIIKADDVFCCLGTTIKVAGSQEAFRKVDFTYPVQIAALALKNGAKQFLVVTSVGANSQSSIFYNRVKGEVEEAVAKLPFQSLHIFRPSLLLGERKEFRPGEKIGMAAMKSFSFLMIGGMKKYRAIEANVLARGMVRTAKENLNGIQVYESDQIQLIADKSN